MVKYSVYMTLGGGFWMYDYVSGGDVMTGLLIGDCYLGTIRFFTL